MIKCSYCDKCEGQVKAGLNKSGSQRYRCKECQRRYTPEPKEHGYSGEIRQSAIENSVDGMNYRRIGPLLGVDHHTVMNWVKAHTDRLPNSPPLPEKAPDVSELDELYSFIGDKKTGSMS